MELKGIPKCASLVVGHNGVGEFSIWYVSLFFLPADPICFFCFLRGLLATGLSAWTIINMVFLKVFLSLAYSTHYIAFFFYFKKNLFVIWQFMNWLQWFYFGFCPFEPTTPASISSAIPPSLNSWSLFLGYPKIQGSLQKWYIFMQLKFETTFQNWSYFFFLSFISCWKYLWHLASIQINKI